MVAQVVDPSSVLEEPAEPKQPLKASAWGWIALLSTIVSAIGYATQTILDYVPDPSIVGALVYFGLFAGFALAALLSGVIAVVTGRKRADHTLHLGLLAVGYVALAQTIQSIWD
jgi:lysylphosphatidylglycerol synthetase-like protein (DUF2156 family)